MIPVDTKDISGELLLPNKKIKLLSYDQFQKYSWEELRMFCHIYGRYTLVTKELIEYLKYLIGDRDVIEIGAGAGDLGYHLGIRMTDSKMQRWAAIRKRYLEMGQPTIDYPDDVEELDALAAVKKYKPKVVVASWITTFSEYPTFYNSSSYGILEEEILQLVDEFIIIGNKDFHVDKPIMKYPCHKIAFPFLLSRSSNPQGNRIYVIHKKHKADEVYLIDN